MPYDFGPIGTNCSFIVVAYYVRRVKFLRVSVVRSARLLSAFRASIGLWSYRNEPLHPLSSLGTPPGVSIIRKNQATKKIQKVKHLNDTKLDILPVLFSACCSSPVLTFMLRARRRCDASRVKFFPAMVFTRSDIYIPME